MWNSLIHSENHWAFILLLSCVWRVLLPVAPSLPAYWPVPHCWRHSLVQHFLYSECEHSFYKLKKRNHRQGALSILRAMQDKLQLLKFWFWETYIDMLLTFAVQPLPDYPPQQWATVVTEGGRLVVVDVELVRDIDAEALVYRLPREDTRRNTVN